MATQAILYVDDERIVLQSLRDQIAKYFGNQYSSEFAGSIDEAWKIVGELDLGGIKILIIVSDWLMPDVYGDELLIQVHQRFPKIITVPPSGQSNNTATERVHRDANLHAHSPKLWNEATLIGVITSGLGVRA
ncbi:MAG: response regulator [Synechococcales cyanobacterium C42_A2020_086]|jgi:CheY-like chemotaxis protein|nr:response regulator [Synechococcales cyanobacterium C42_A2020_086]